MNLTNYNYNKSDSLNNKIEAGALQEEIQHSDISVAIYGVVGDNGEYEVTFKDELSIEEKAILDDLIANHTGEAIEIVEKVKLSEAHDAAGNLIVVPEKRVGSDLDVATHNFADKTTWFSDSVRVENETPTKIDAKSYQLSNLYIIDLQHGKVHAEDKTSASIEHGYKVVVRCNGEVVSELTPFSPDDNDCAYTVDYGAGIISFIEDHTDEDISVDYSYATTSSWYLRPIPGKRIQIEKSEVQFSDDLDYNDAVDFEIWAYNPEDLPNKVPIKINSYKSIHNFVDEAAGAYPMIPPVGGPILGKTKPTLGFPFNYNTIRDLDSSMGVELVIKTRNGREFGGERATATFYCTVHDV